MKKKVVRELHQRSEFLRSAAALLPGPPSRAALHRTGLAQERAHVLVVTMQYFILVGSKSRAWRGVKHSRCGDPSGSPEESVQKITTASNQTKIFVPINQLFLPLQTASMYVSPNIIASLDHRILAVLTGNRVFNAWGEPRSFPHPCVVCLL